VAKLNSALLTAIESTPVKARMQVLGLEAIPSTPAQMKQYTNSERGKWGAVIKASGIKVE
jgi:tripartite-type tricarboxylate transporter receptor subunit TctC